MEQLRFDRVEFQCGEFIDTKIFHRTGDVDGRIVSAGVFSDANIDLIQFDEDTVSLNAFVVVSRFSPRDQSTNTYGFNRCAGEIRFLGDAPGVFFDIETNGFLCLSGFEVGSEQTSF